MHICPFKRRIWRRFALPECSNKCINIGLTFILALDGQKASDYIIARVTAEQQYFKEPKKNNILPSWIKRFTFHIHIIFTILVLS